MQSGRLKIHSLFNTHNLWLRVLFLAYLMLSLFGCGYSIEKRSGLPFDSISIGRIENNTSEPRLQDRLTKSLAETFMLYGFQINPYSQYKIEGRIVRFEMRPVAEKASSATQYEIMIRADFKLINTANGSFQTFSINNPYYVFFGSVGSIEHILAQKDIASGRALDDLSQEVVRRIIYSELRDF